MVQPDKALTPFMAEKLRFESVGSTCVKAVRKNIKKDLRLRPKRRLLLQSMRSSCVKTVPQNNKNNLQPIPKRLLLLLIRA